MQTPEQFTRERHPHMSDSFVQLIANDVAIYAGQVVAAKLKVESPNKRDLLIDTLIFLATATKKQEQALRDLQIKQDEDKRIAASDAKRKRRQR